MCLYIFCFFPLPLFQTADTSPNSATIRSAIADEKVIREETSVWGTAFSPSSPASRSNSYFRPFTCKPVVVQKPLEADPLEKHPDGGFSHTCAVFALRFLRRSVTNTKVSAGPDSTLRIHSYKSALYVQDTWIVSDRKKP